MPSNETVIGPPTPPGSAWPASRDGAATVGSSTSRTCGRIQTHPTTRTVRRPARPPSRSTDRTCGRTGAVPLDEQDLVEIQQRIGQGDATPHAARVGEQFAASRIVGRVDSLTRLLDWPVPRRRQSVGSRLQSAKWLKQRGGAAEHDIGRIPILVQDQGLAAIRGGGHLLEMRLRLLSDGLPARRTGCSVPRHCAQRAVPAGGQHGACDDTEPCTTRARDSQCA